MNPVVHFEMPYHDRDRMARFYGDVFGWQTRMLGPDMGNYVVAVTTETGDMGPKNPGAINGGFHERSAAAATHPSVVISVDDIRDAMTKVTAAGGTMLSEPMEIPGIGLYASFNDPEGNRISMLQPARRQGA